jgi:riboflavin synthase
MFTGIIEAVGTVRRVRDVEGGRQLWFESTPELLSGVAIGDSIAVDGACLTVAELAGPDAGTGASSPAFRVDVVLSTLERTIAGRYEPGTEVNLERAMVLGARLDGHLVQGHVDGVGHLTALRDEGGTHFLDFEVPGEIWNQTLLHGSITLNGVSLTVNAMQRPGHVQIAIIPHTWQVTNLRRLQPGDPVNVEGDLLGKYVGRILETRRDHPGAPHNA